MRHNKYKVTLSSNLYIVHAFNEKEAIILAQAEAIRDARDYEFVSIEELNPFASRITVN